MNYKSFLPYFIFIFCIASLIGGIYFLFLNRNSIFSNNTSGNSIPNILYLTNPVTEFIGKIDKISGNSIWVSGKYTITPPPTPPTAPTNIPGQTITVPPLPPTKIITYKINIAPFTIINRPETPIKYLFKKITPTPSPKLTNSDIHVGQLVSAYSKDLRTLTNQEFDAYSIKLPTVINSITGKIASIDPKEGIIVLKAVPPITDPTQLTPEPKEKEYSISVTENTEISRMGYTEKPKATSASPSPTPQAVKYSINDLKIDLQITVYADSDITEVQNLKALRIEPAIDLFPSTTPSPTTKPAPSVKK